MTGIGFGRGKIGRLDLIPISIGLAPENCAPGLVELIERVIFCLQPLAEGTGARTAVAAGGAVAAKLIIDLPADDIWVAPVAGSHRRNNLLGVLAITRAVGAVMSPRSIAQAASLDINREDIRVCPAQPGWWRCCWRAENDLQPLFSQHIDRSIEPVPVELALAWFHNCPGKFCDPHKRYPSLFHELGIQRPALLRPVFGVVAHA